MLMIGFILGAMVGIIVFIHIDEWNEYKFSGWLMDHVLRSRPVAGFRAWRAMNDVMCDINMALEKEVHE